MPKEALKTLVSQKLMEVESWFCACDFIFIKATSWSCNFRWAWLNAKMFSANHIAGFLNFNVSKNNWSYKTDLFNAGTYLLKLQIDEILVGCGQSCPGMP